MNRWKCAGKQTAERISLRNGEENGKEINKVALAGPVLGTMADTKGFKKPIFTGAILTGVIGCALLGLAKGWMLFLVIYIIAKVGFSSSLIFYDSMLGDVTDEDRMDYVSSAGYAWGYIGSCVPFIVCLVLVLGSGKIGISMEMAMGAAFLIIAVWWLVMSLPLLKGYEQKFYVKKQKHAVKESFCRLGQTFVNIRKEKHIFMFLLAFFFYIDGVYTIIDMATAYGSALGLDSTGLLLALLVTQLVAFPCAILFGKLSGKMETSRLITVCIFAYLGIAIFAVFLKSQIQFWILAVLVGMFQGGIQALSCSVNQCHFAIQKKVKRCILHRKCHSARPFNFGLFLYMGRRECGSSGE